MVVDIVTNSLDRAVFQICVMIGLTAILLKEVWDQWLKKKVKKWKKERKVKLQD